MDGNNDNRLFTIRGVGVV
ncbi:Protein of unknown function [Propionibacterium freudenreichii]|nr:Protein of unknown function [Propionibacterium freudenreichii subsp. freudenreichii]CEG95281.1 Protein of unknown function [Propionibacterium freudenreichii]CEH07911.1 Protein of unknown function [Propionibacterium freudenreichii]CEI23042.1 Protein of unknown function [Propionibacterium freudenreichii]